MYKKGSEYKLKKKKKSPVKHLNKVFFKEDMLHSLHQIFLFSITKAELLMSLESYIWCIIFVVILACLLQHFSPHAAIFGTE